MHVETELKSYRRATRTAKATATVAMAAMGAVVVGTAILVGEGVLAGEMAGEPTMLVVVWTGVGTSTEEGMVGGGWTVEATTGTGAPAGGVGSTATEVGG